MFTSNIYILVIYEGCLQDLNDLRSPLKLISDGAIGLQLVFNSNI